MVEEMYNILSRMGVDSRFKGGCRTSAFPMYITSVGSLDTINLDKEFPNFKTDPSKLCRQNYSIVDMLIERADEPLPEIKIMTHHCNKKKRRRRRRRRKKKSTQTTQKTEPQTRRQRQLSTTSEDSFIMFEEDCPISDNEAIEEVYSSDSTVTQKKVRFADDSELCQVHPMVMWAYAYQAARKGPWEEYARDRDRFRKRVEKTEADIGHVFTAKHRTKIYNERFAE